MKQKSFLLFFYFNYISSFYLTKILLITSDYNMTILVGNYFVVLGHVELFLSREAVGMENECFTKTEERQLGSQPRCGSKMVLTVVTSILVTPPPTHCDFSYSTISTHHHHQGKRGDTWNSVKHSLLWASMLKSLLG